MQLLHYAKVLLHESTNLGLNCPDWLPGKNVLQEGKASKSTDWEIGKRGSILGERISTHPFPTLFLLSAHPFFIKS